MKHYETQLAGLVEKIDAAEGQIQYFENINGNTTKKIKDVNKKIEAQGFGFD